MEGWRDSGKGGEMGMDGWMGELMVDGWMDRRMDGWVDDGWMN
jgi:hypothetical protein